MMTRFGHPHIHLRETDSTNERARALAESGAASGTIVTADAQSAGRGRHGRVWAAPPGKALLLSAILRPLEARHALLPLAVPVAVSEAIDELAPVSCEIKWPNDIWIDERKVAGVLIEARPPQWAVIGIGVNVSIGANEFPDDLRWPATSIGGDASVAEVREVICARLEVWSEADREQMLAAFRKRDALRDRRVSWEGGEGRAVGIDEDGNILIDHGEGEFVARGSGEVSLRLDR